MRGSVDPPGVPDMNVILHLVLLRNSVPNTFRVHDKGLITVECVGRRSSKSTGCMLTYNRI
jgi:hypothetical protein